jgi:hypothetical protein
MVPLAGVGPYQGVDLVDGYPQPIEAFDVGVARGNSKLKPAKDVVQLRNVFGCVIGTVTDHVVAPLGRRAYEIERISMTSVARAQNRATSGASRAASCWRSVTAAFAATSCGAANRRVGRMRSQ